MRLLLFTLCLILSITPSHASSLSPEENLKRAFYSSVTDSSAHAFVLEELGSSHLEIHEHDQALRVVHSYKVRIKIVDRQGFEEANFSIPLHAFGKTFEYVEDVKGLTHNVNEGGKTVTTTMLKEAIFTEKKSDYLQLLKFTLPNIREGSIIDVEYRLISPDIMNFRTWNFQSHLPKKKSEYVALFPATYQYQVTLRGPQKLSDSKSEMVSGCFLSYGVRQNCSKMTYTMEDIPAFKQESNMLAKQNYLSAIYFELGTYYYRGVRNDITKKWSDVDKDLMLEKQFGGQLKEQGLFKDLIHRVDGKSDLEKAQEIYDYIKSQISWNHYVGKYAQNGIKKSLESRVGNVGDINLALVTALQAAKISCYPVILATRDNETPNKLHPVITNFNYVIAHVKIDDQEYFLDATNPYLPFGELPLHCINDQGRIIYSRKSSEWIDLKMHKPSTLHYSFNGVYNPDTKKIEGQMSRTTTSFDALRTRTNIKSVATLAEYEENLQKELPALELTLDSVINLDKYGEALVEIMQVNIPMDDFIQGNILHINPTFLGKNRFNLFDIEERKYPLDLGAKQDCKVTISIKFPKEYSLKHGPVNKRFSLPEQSAQYNFVSTFEDNYLQVRHSTMLNKALYSVEEYYHLKEFFNLIGQQEKLDFTLSF